MCSTDNRVSPGLMLPGTLCSPMGPPGIRAQPTGRENPVIVDMVMPLVAWDRTGPAVTRDGGGAGDLPVA
jgi:hypothetical protein